MSTHSSRMKTCISAHYKGMYLGEMALLVASALVMTGLAKGITARLKLNDFAATFLIFVIVLLNVRGEIKMTENYGFKDFTIFIDICSSLSC